MTWSLVGNLEGPPGPTGPAGPSESRAIPNPVTTLDPLTVPAGHELLYFDQLVNDGTLTIEDGGVLVGVEPLRPHELAQPGIANPITTEAFVPAGHEVLYLDRLVNDGVLWIEDGGHVAGITPSPSTSRLTGTPTVVGTGDITGPSLVIPAGGLTANGMVEFDVRGFCAVGGTGGTVSAWISVNGVKQASASYAVVAMNTTVMWLYQGQLTFKTVGSSGTYVAIASISGGPRGGIDGSGLGVQTGGITPAAVDTTQDITLTVGLTGATGLTSYIETGRLTRLPT